MRARRQGGGVDDLRLAPPQPFQVAHQRDGVAHARADVHALAANGGEPLHLARFQVEQVDDRARHPEQVAQRPQRRLGDGGGRFLPDHPPVDLVQDRQSLGIAHSTILRC